MSNGYHGLKPVTDSDKKMAKKHLDMTKELSENKQDLLEDKIDDHKKALKKAVKEGNKKSAIYNRSHMDEHKKDLTEAKADSNKVNESLMTLHKLKPTYNDVRKAKVSRMAERVES